MSILGFIGVAAGGTDDAAVGVEAVGTTDDLEDMDVFPLT